MSSKVTACDPVGVGHALLLLLCSGASVYNLYTSTIENGVLWACLLGFCIGLCLRSRDPLWAIEKVEEDDSACEPDAIHISEQCQPESVPWQYDNWVSSGTAEQGEPAKRGLRGGPGKFLLSKDMVQCDPGWTVLGQVQHGDSRRSCAAPGDGRWTARLQRPWSRQRKQRANPQGWFWYFSSRPYTTTLPRPGLEETADPGPLWVGGGHSGTDQW